MKKIMIILVALAAAAGACLAGKMDGSIIHEGRNREYHLHVPASYDGTKPFPLVIVLHGGGGNARQIERFTGFSKLADREGFLAVYPQGIDGQWNDGRDVRQSRAHRLKIDDTGFIVEMIKEMTAKYRVNPEQDLRVRHFKRRIHVHPPGLRAFRNPCGGRRGLRGAEPVPGKDPQARIHDIGAYHERHRGPARAV